METLDSLDVHMLAEEARRLGYTPKLVVNRLMRRIVRDQNYLERRQRRGISTSHDEMTAEDALVTALARELLQGGTI